tara:strand:+ start:529 stop:699 length:171 start_codon:yes stop_codon:yes gene_type:complete
MKNQYAAKSRIKDNKDWSSIYFWAENDDEANQIWEKRFKSDWPSMEYKLEKVEKDA